MSSLATTHASVKIDKTDLGVMITEDEWLSDPTDADVAAFGAYCEQYEADVSSGDDVVQRELAMRSVWTTTPPASRRFGQNWRAVSREFAFRTREIRIAARAAAAALIATTALLVAALVNAIVSTVIRWIDAQWPAHQASRLRHLPHVALSPRLAARPRGGRALLVAA